MPVSAATLTQGGLDARLMMRAAAHAVRAVMPARVAGYYEDLCSETVLQALEARRRGYRANRRVYRVMALLAMRIIFGDSEYRGLSTWDAHLPLRQEHEGHSEAPHELAALCSLRTKRVWPTLNRLQRATVVSVVSDVAPTEGAITFGVTRHTFVHAKKTALARIDDPAHRRRQWRRTSEAWRQTT